MAASDRVPSLDSEHIRAGTYLKLMKRGAGPPVPTESEALVGYLDTFYTDDGYDSGTAVEIKKWGQATEYERQVLEGRRVGDEIRIWECSGEQRTLCKVYDWQILAPPASN
jgi:hypothetical protein